MKAGGLAALLALGLCPARIPSASAGDADRSAAPVAIAAELSAETGRTRLTVTLSKRMTPSVLTLDRPDRIVVELPETNCQLGLDDDRRRVGLVTSVRCGLAGPSRARIVLDLAAPASVARLDVENGTVPGSSVLTVELVRTERDSFRRAAAAGQADLVSQTGSLGRALEADRRPIIALDAGHGGSDPGARAISGTAEKEITLAFAQELRARLAAGDRYRLLMIRDHDVFVPLDERVRRAREAGAQLFVSIHADAIGNPLVGGATVYTGAERATDAESSILAERENAADLAGGLARAAAPGEIADILHDLTLRETRTHSTRFSDLLLKDMGLVARLSAHPKREASFRVLRNADLPSVLVELGYMSNARDLERMTSPEWRSRTVAAMASALDRFFAAAPLARAPISP